MICPREDYPDFNFYEINGMRLTCPEQTYVEMWRLLTGIYLSIYIQLAVYLSINQSIFLSIYLSISISISSIYLGEKLVHEQAMKKLDTRSGVFNVYCSTFSFKKKKGKGKKKVKGKRKQAGREKEIGRGKLLGERER